MRCCLFLFGALGLWLGLAAAPSVAGERPLTLGDEGLPLQELRPLDRHVYVLTLDGAWKQPPTDGVAYHVNLLFPDGGSYAHRVLDAGPFRAGEVRCLIPEYQLVRHGLARGGQFTIVISAKCPVNSATDAEVVSNVFPVRWPLDRAIVRWAPPTRHSPPAPIDALPLPGQAPPRVAPTPGERLRPPAPAPKSPAPPRKTPPPDDGVPPVPDDR
jgi:hypothetical protein